MNRSPYWQQLIDVVSEQNYNYLHDNFQALLLDSPKD